MNTEPKNANEEYLEIMRQLCQQTPGSFEWFSDLLEAGLVWDHIVDGDTLDVAMADRVFVALVTRWPLNPWWTRNAVVLVPVLINAISAWRWSNQKNAPKDRAYDIYTEVPATMAFLIGGQAAVDHYLPRLRDLAQARLIEDEQEDGGKK